MKKNEIPGFIAGFPTQQLALGGSLCRDPASNPAQRLVRARQSFSCKETWVTEPDLVVRIQGQRSNSQKEAQIWGLVLGTH